MSPGGPGAGGAHELPVPRRQPSASPVRLATLALAGLLGVACAAAAEPGDPGNSRGAPLPGLVVDGALRYQIVQGVGTSVNAHSWDSGRLRPALDLLIDRGGHRLLRVVHDPMDWVADEADIARLARGDPEALARVHETPALRDLWETVAYLNGKGLRGEQLLLAFMGWTPRWMGGSGAFGARSVVLPAKEEAFAVQMAALVHYARRVRHLDFGLLAPLNEPDADGREGPAAAPAQVSRLLGQVASRLGALGLGEVRLVGPETAFGLRGWLPELFADPAASSSIAHLGLHQYARPVQPPAGLGPRDAWVTETAQWCATCDQNGAPPEGEWAFARETGQILLQDLLNGFSAVFSWEGFDGYYHHHQSYSTWGLLAFDQRHHTYTPRKRFWVAAQLASALPAGAVRLGAVSQVAGLTAAAFRHPETGELAILGHNRAGSLVLHGRLDRLEGLPARLTLQHLQTDGGARDLSPAPAVPVVDGAFTVRLAREAFFSLSSRAPPVR